MSKQVVSSMAFHDFLKQYRIEKGAVDKTYTHTRIPDKSLNIYGGTYNIPLVNKSDTKEFYKKYYEHVFENGHPEYLTERQLIDNGPILIDLDIRYSTDIVERLHTTNHIIDFIGLYAGKISEYYDIPDKTQLTVYVLQKSSVKCEKERTKDGIHVIIAMQAHKAVQSLLRQAVIPELEQMWDDLPMTNPVEELFDEAVAKGHVGWQCFGSRKPKNEPYELNYIYKIQYNIEEDFWNIDEEYSISGGGKGISLKEHVPLMSARYTGNPEFPVKEAMIEKIKTEKANLHLKDSNVRGTDGANAGGANAGCANAGSNGLSLIDLELFDYGSIKTAETLEKLLENLFDNITPADYELKETHDFTMILPVQYYGDGSYSKWIRVGWALKNTDKKLFLTWMKFSSQSPTFDYRDIPKYYQMWQGFDHNNPDGLTNRSIMYWAKIDNPKAYDEVRQNTVGYFIEETITKPTEYDLANVLYQMYKDQFVCVSIKNNVWYEYKKYRWHEIDSGNTLRLYISKKMHDIYMRKVKELVEKMATMNSETDNMEAMKARSNKLMDICVHLKTTNWKNNIMKEAKELFYDRTFMNKLDCNPYLLCFNNYVVDFKSRTYRRGQPDDYISKCTNIDYIPSAKLKKMASSSSSGTRKRDTEDDDGVEDCSGSMNTTNTKTADHIADIQNFMRSLFPEEALHDYMWEHLASCLIGTNENQTFNIYTGSGCNGKSKLVEFMTHCLGDYKATVPITLITQKRNNIGSTSSEVVQLMGVRYAVMQEPTKGDKINEGIMKEITGGDPIQGRALFKDSITFTPQFKLVVCTNTLFDINSNDDGTWRRIRVCDFMSKFVDEPFVDLDKFPRENFPHQYQIDRKIDEKFTEWAPIMMSLLVDVGFRTAGRVKDCKQVLSVSDNYRESQDYLTEFAKEKIQKCVGKKIKKTEVLEEFKNWYIINYGRATLPNGREICEFMDKTYGKCNRGKWFNVEIIYEDLDDEDADLFEETI